MVHLAEFIQDEMCERGWDLDRLVLEMIGPRVSAKEWAVCKLSWELFFAIQDANVVLGDEMAQQLASALDISASFFTSFHEEWRKHARVN